MNTAILYVCTGEYIKFWPEFHASAEAHLFPGLNRNYFVFTDGKLTAGTNVTAVHQDSLGWPFNTLYRFRMFLRLSEQLQSYSHVLFMNANCVVQRPIAHDEVFPPGSDLVACLHPGFYNKQSSEFTYERRRESRACVEGGTSYRAGGMMGGTVPAFLHAAEQLVENIESDLRNGLLAIWHDESHWNAYLNNAAVERNQRIHDLSPSFLYPEGWDLPFEPRVLLRDKSKVVDVDRIKGHGTVRSQTTRGGALRALIRRLLNKAAV